MHSGATVAGGRVLSPTRTLWEMNAYARAGAVLALSPRRVGAWLGGARTVGGPLVFQIWPGSTTSGNVTLKEEAGTVVVRYTLQGSTLSVTITRTHAAPTPRAFTIQLQQSAAPVTATGAATGVAYNARKLQTELTIPPTAEATVSAGATFAFPASNNPSLQTDFVGKRTRLHRCVQGSKKKRS